MNNNVDRVLEYIKPYLLSNIVLKTDKKILKRGKLKIFQTKQHYIRLILDVNGSSKMFELPYPYDVHVDGNVTTLNYKLTSFIKDEDLMLQTKLLDTSHKSKMYDTFVYLLNSEEDGL
jgi:hypothetical protein